ncbi:PREDICTED: putative pumilio homolog 10 isoform X1 [Camelina sativa]|uniref:Pumilio homolog 10 isoform X1 n=1 Tax=Camelina sativa TaxID=90675 RepID=A0ABM0X0T8_CAMSA|nr:PREDICTED: putative pumilio homolog 10 isoform X1 [Camelina sativa]
MFGERRFMGFGGFQGDFNLGRALPLPPDFGSDGFLTKSLDTNPFLKNQCYNKSGDALDLCRKLNKMGISCDMSIWTKPEEEPFRVDPGDFGSKATTLHRSSGFDFEQEDLTGGAASQIHHDGFRNFSSVCLQNNNFHGASPPEELRLLGFQDSLNPNGYEETMASKTHRDFLFDHIHQPIKRSPCLRGNNGVFKGSLMFEKFRVSQTLAAMEGSGAYYPEDTSLMRSIDLPLPLSLVSMVDMYGSVILMAKDQTGCRVLQKLVDQGTFLETNVIFLEIIDHVVELSMDPFGNYIVQKLIDACDEEQRTLFVSVLTSKPRELIKICLNTYGTRVVQKMIETVRTKHQMALVKSGLKPGFLALVKDLNGNHVIQSCLQSLGPNDNKFVLEAATKHCAEIAVHRHGCCVLQCCVANSVGPQHERLVAEISRNALRLSQDPFGNYVVQFLIEQKFSAVRLLVQFRNHYAELATQKFSSHVIEKCLREYPESRSEIVRELLSSPDFEYILQDPYANYVIQTALSVTKGAVRAILLEKVYRFGKLRSSPYCKKIFSKTILKK